MGIRFYHEDHEGWKLKFNGIGFKLQHLQPADWDGKRARGTSINI
jgi:hypothetical protein